MKNEVNGEETSLKEITEHSISKEPVGASKDRILAVIFLLVGSVSAGFVGGYFGAEQSNNPYNSSHNQSQQIISSEAELITKIANDVGESVVSIDVTERQTQQSIFGGSRSITQASAGTGIIISENGTILTNRHVIPKEATSVSVTLSDGTILDDVEVVGRTNDGDTLDIAFLKIKDTKGKKLKPAKIGDSASMQVGDKVIAIGNALGQFQNTVTSGIISGYGRDVEAGDDQSSEALQNLFQTDAAINQGNSGGPLVNINGEIIGLNTAVAGGEAQNIGFAIPIDDVKGLIKSVLDKGQLLRPYLGVRYVMLTDDYAFEYNLDIKRGAYIAPSLRGQKSILENSPASKAGLKEKDIIIKVNDRPIDEKNSLISVLGRFSVGDKVTLTIMRDGKEQKVDVNLEAAPQN